MTVYVILFRGVGGATQLPVKPLREALTAAGFDDVATYINSGNAVARSAMPGEAVAEKIAAICAERFGFRKAVFATPRDDWRGLVANNPFADGEAGGKWLHAAVLAQAPEPGRVAALTSLAQDGERFAVLNRVAYLHTPAGFSASKLARSFDKGIGVANTARNWNTVLKLLALGEAVGA